MNKLFLLILLSTALSANAKKLYLPIEYIIGHADLIVIGEIAEVQDTTYTFQVSQTLKGKSEILITVEKFPEWICDTRFAKHKKGQKLCLFLKRNQTTWEIINGGTGERQIRANDIMLGESESYTSNRININEFAQAIKSFCECYELIESGNPFEGQKSFRQLVTNEQLNTVSKQSEFSTWLFEKVKNYPKSFGF